MNSLVSRDNARAYLSIGSGALTQISRAMRYASHVGKTEYQWNEHRGRDIEGLSVSGRLSGRHKVPMTTDIHGGPQGFSTSLIGGRGAIRSRALGKRFTRSSAESARYRLWNQFRLEFRTGALAIPGSDDRAIKARDGCRGS